MGGFVYIWYDVKRKMFYLGSHWGAEDDGYICSSVRMKRAFKRRPADFKRRILNRCAERTALLAEEQRWLQMIPDEHLGVKYYNLHRRTGHWHGHSDRSMVVEKLKQSWTEERKQSASIKQSLAWTDARREHFRELTLGRKRDDIAKTKMRAMWTKERKAEAATRLRKMTKKRFENWETHLTRKEKLAQYRLETGWQPADLSLKSKRSWQKVKSDPQKLKHTTDKMSAAKKGKVWVVNESGPKLILPAELELHLNTGWSRGRTLTPSFESIRKRKF